MFRSIGRSRLQDRGALLGKCEIIHRITGAAEPEMLYTKLTIVTSEDTHDPTVTKITKSFLTGWIEATINHDAHLPRASQYLTHFLETVMFGICKGSHSAFPLL
jgi:hypothetical protein